MGSIFTRRGVAAPESKIDFDTEEKLKMICQTIRSGSDCAFMKATGCGYNKGVCAEAVESCEGCGRLLKLDSGIYCSIFPEPVSKWRNGNCNMATHVTTEVKVSKQKINPLKASKRANR